MRKHKPLSSKEQEAVEINGNVLIYVIWAGLLFAGVITLLILKITGLM